jgi:CRP-like cAMP-binding protein
MPSRPGGSLSHERGALSGNVLLDRLPADDRARVVAAGQIVPLSRGTILHAYDTPIRHVWFPTSGIVSLATSEPSGHEIETAIGGRESLVGLQVLLDDDSLSGQATVQLDGEALCIPAPALHTLLDELPTLRPVLNHFVLSLFTQVMQLSLCNRLHVMEERCARWLLMCHDRAPADSFHITHEYLARLLGVRRASVTVTMGMLQAAGMLRYRQGLIEVLDRPLLEQASCECYEVIQRELARLVGIDWQSTTPRG